MTQRDLILQYLDDFGSITPMQAFADLGITKLSTRVSEMRKNGIGIGDKWVKGKNRYGKPVEFKMYFRSEDEQKVLLD